LIRPEEGGPIEVHMRAKDRAGNVGETSAKVAEVHTGHPEQSAGHVKRRLRVLSPAVLGIGLQPVDDRPCLLLRRGRRRRLVLILRGRLGVEQLVGGHVPDEVVPDDGELVATTYSTRNGSFVPGSGHTRSVPSSRSGSSFSTAISNPRDTLSLIFRP